MSVNLATAPFSHASAHVIDAGKSQSMGQSMAESIEPHSHDHAYHASMGEHGRMDHETSTEPQQCADTTCVDKAVTTCCSAMAGACAMIFTVDQRTLPAVMTCNELHDRQADQIASGRMPEADTPPPRS